MRRFLMAAALALAAGSAKANFFDDFAGAAQSDIKPFAKDVGGLIGANDFHSADLPAFLGFDVGATGVIQTKPDDDDAVLKNAGAKALALPMVRVEAGLPAGFSVFLRGVGYEGASLIGGGARYQIYKSGLLIAIPSVAATFGYDSLSQDVFKLGHVGGSVQASWSLPIVHPFIGVGYDSTKVTIKENLNGSLVGASDTGEGSRVTVGLDITPFPFTYLYAAYSNLHGDSAGQVGAGLRFGGL